MKLVNSEKIDVVEYHPTNINVEFISVASLQTNFFLLVVTSYAWSIDEKYRFEEFCHKNKISSIIIKIYFIVNLKLYDNYFYKSIIFGKTFQYDSNSKWNQKTFLGWNFNY